MAASTKAWLAAGFVGGWADWGMGGLGGEMGGWLGWADGWDERIIHLFVWGDGGILGLDSHDALC